MSKPEDYPSRNIFTPLMESGPWELLLTLLLAAIGLYHLTLSIRALVGRGRSMSAGTHGLLLFSGPCIFVLSVCAMLPTTLPNLFVHGIDADAALKHGLELTAFLGWFSLGLFIPNLFLALRVLTR